MGFCPDSTPEMGPYSVEVRNESFYLRGEGNFDAQAGAYVEKHHGIFLYPNASGQGTAEIRIADISMIRAALDQVERVHYQKLEQ
jgi:hypothetical protein